MFTSKILGHNEYSAINHTCAFWTQRFWMTKKLHNETCLSETNSKLNRNIHLATKRKFKADDIG